MTSEPAALTDEHVTAAIGRDDPWDTLHGPSPTQLHWATSNLGEAMPGVQTPLSWSLWADPTEHAPRGAAYRIGGLKRSERAIPARAEDRFVSAFPTASICRSAGAVAGRGGSP